ncbi:MAG: sulfotransferase [Bacteroidota bacterium]
MSANHFFILGRPRSGTTLLKALFDAHPNVKIAPELPVFLTLYQKFKKIAVWDKQAMRSFIDHVFQPAAFNNRKLENLKIDRAVFTKDIMGMPDTSSIQDLLFKINEHSFSFYPKDEVLQIGDKNPVYSVFTKRLIKIFPEARFICITRDYRDNFISVRNLKEIAFEAPVLALQIARWRYINRSFIEYCKRFPKQFYLIRYEDMVEKPEESFSALCKFLEIPFCSSVFDFYKKKDEMVETFNNPNLLKIHASLMNPVNTGRLGLWREQMTEKETRLADQIAGKTADALKYVRLDRRFSFMLWIKSLPMGIYSILLLYYVVGFVSAVPRKQMARHKYYHACQVIQ